MKRRYNIFINNKRTRTAYASDKCPAPGDSPGPGPAKDVAKPKPGFKPLTRRQIGPSTSSDSDSTICAIAGDYLLGGACIILVFVFLNIVNRK